MSLRPVILLALALGACSAPVTRPTPGARADVPSAIGAACKPGPALQGSCPAGYLCFPARGGGHCTRLCGLEDCPRDATCVPSARGGELCARSCGSDGDCRPGLRCDGSWRACLAPGMLPLALSRRSPSGAVSGDRPLAALSYADDGMDANGAIVLTSSVDGRAWARAVISG